MTVFLMVFYGSLLTLGNIMALTHTSDKNKKGVTAITKKAPINDQRLVAFKHWLATKANITITNDAQYQDCYKSIGKPTKKEIWEKLQEVDRKLFSAGDLSFFRKQNIINFKVGPGRNRSLKF